VLHAFEVPFEGKLRVSGVAEDDVLRYRRQARERARTDMEALLGSVTLHALAAADCDVLVVPASARAAR